MRTTAERFGFLPVEECDLTRRVLIDDALQAAFDEQGYVVVPFLGPDEIARLVDGYRSAASRDGGINPPDAYNDEYAEFSIIHSRPQFRREAFELISSVLVPRADDFLVDYRPIIANYVNKPAGTGVVPAHQNFSVVDECRFQSVSVWVALVDCQVRNGAMSMLDGSHLRLRGVRGMWAYQSFSEIEDAIIEHHLTPVEVPAGHAVILDDALVHYSPANQSDEPRLAIQFVMTPRDADALWFQQIGEADADDRIDVAVWRVDERFFFDFWHGDGDEEFAERLDTVQVPAARLDELSFRSLLGTDSLTTSRRLLTAMRSRWRRVAAN